MLVENGAATGVMDPGGLEFGPDGAIYFVDEAAGSLSVVLADGGTKRIAIGLGSSEHLAIARNSTFYVSNNSGDLFHINMDGQVETIPKYSPPDGGIVDPAVLVVNSQGNLVLNDFWTGNVYEYMPDNSKRRLQDVPYGTRDFVLDGLGNIYATSGQTDRIDKIAANGDVTHIGEYKKAKGIAIDAAGNLYATANQNTANSKEFRIYRPDGGMSRIGILPNSAAKFILVTPAGDKVFTTEDRGRIYMSVKI